MKSTGIIRRVDDLGRVVIPKEIRRTMKINEGDPLEIFVNDDAVCFRKYNTNENIESEIQRLVSLVKDDYDMDSGFKSGLLYELNKVIELFNNRSQ